MEVEAFDAPMSHSIASAFLQRMHFWALPILYVEFVLSDLGNAISIEQSSHFAPQRWIHFTSYPSLECH